MLLALLVACIMGLVFLGTVLSIFFGLLGFAFQSAFAAILFVLKYALPVVVVAAIIALVFRKRYFKEAFIGTGAVLLAAEIIFAIFFFCTEADVKLVPAETVTRVRFSSTSASKDFWGRIEGWELSDYGETTDMAYLERLYAEIAGNTYKNSIEESVDVEEIGGCMTAELYDGEKRLGAVSFYGSEYLAVERGSVTRYYKTKEGSMNDDVMYQLSTDVNNREIHEKWDAFAAALEASLEADEAAVYFTIPEEVPEGTYNLYTDIVGSYVDENNRVQTYGMDMQWEVEKNQSWQPGVYRMELGDRTVDSCTLTLRVGTVSWEMDFTGVMPEHKVLRK